MITPLDNKPLSARIFEYMYLKSPPLSEVAEHFGISSHELNSELNSICGMNAQSVSDRVQRFCSVALLIRDISLKDIWVNSGFSSQASFYRVFNELCGCAPNVLRSNLLTTLGGDEQNRPGGKMVEICRYIRDNFTEDISLASCSEALYIDTSEINKIVKRVFDCSFTTSLSRLRLCYAAGLLSSTKMSVGDIAFEVGFGTVHVFICNLKEYMV